MRTWSIGMLSRLNNAPPSSPAQRCDYARDIGTWSRARRRERRTATTAESISAWSPRSAGTSTRRKPNMPPPSGLPLNNGTAFSLRTQWTAAKMTWKRGATEQRANEQRHGAPGTAPPRTGARYRRARAIRKRSYSQ